MAWPAQANRMPVYAETGELIPVLYSTKVIDHVKSNLVALQVCNTTWSDQLKIGDQLQIPKMTAIAAGTVDPQTSFLSTAKAKAWSTDPATLNIEYWRENPIMLDDSVALQTQVTGLFDIAAKNAAYGLEKAIDTIFVTLFQSLSSTYIGADGQTFTDDLFIQLQEGLDEQDVPRSERALIGDPSMVSDIYKIDKFMSMDYTNRPFTTDAYVGTLPAYNVPVFISNNLSYTTTGAYGALMHKEAIGIALQQNFAVERWRQPDMHADGINVSVIFGCGVLRAEFGEQFYTRKL